MVIALYFFLADGPAMINTLMQLSPLGEEHELELLARFRQISRSVVVATLLSAVAQGIAAGIGYYFVLPSEAPIFLADGADDGVRDRAVRRRGRRLGPVCLWLSCCLATATDKHRDRTGWMVVGFGIYCAVVVSGLDNLIKPYVLHGQANLHPLLALLSILGGVKVLGPVGILVGPMLVSFMQALLSIFQREVERWEIPRKRRWRSYHRRQRHWRRRSRPPSTRTMKKQEKNRRKNRLPRRRRRKHRSPLGQESGGR